MTMQLDSAALDDPDVATILPLGSGGEVGRSCIIYKYKGRSVMLDCGIHPAKEGLDSLPHFDSIDCSTVDVVLITHFHLDHCGALPYLCEQTNFRGRVFMTSATKAFFKMVMNDLLRVGSDSNDVVTSEWLHSTIERIETVEYHEEVVHQGIRFQSFNAGHVLGAAMFSVDIGGAKVLYTGDYSREEDRHLPRAESPPISPHILIVESTYGRREHETRDEREEKFTRWVHEIVAREGRCLIPVFALGRAQELLLILEEYWATHPELQSIPVYYASSLASRCMKLYQTFVGAMNERVQQKHAHNTNPFVFKFIKSLADLKHFEDNGPCVVLASPGMLQPGVSLELFERWCGHERNGIVFAGYCVEGTVADEVMKKKSLIPAEVTKPDGKVLKIRMKTVEAVSFSAHSDARQTRDFISELSSTQHVILVHGNEGAMDMLKEKLSQDFKHRGMAIYTTRNQIAIRVPFHSKKSARVIGSIAAHGEPHPGDAVRGVLLSSGHQQYTIVSPHDIPVFTGLDVSSIQQAMTLPLSVYKSEAEVLGQLRSYFTQSEMFRDVPSTLGETNTSDGPSRISVAKDVYVDVEHDEQSHTTLTITWLSSRMNDILADVTCVALTNLMQRATFDDSEHTKLPMEVTGADRIFRFKCFHHLLSQFYTSVKTDLGNGTCQLLLEEGETVTVKNCIHVDPVGSKGVRPESLLRLTNTLKRIYLTLFPIPLDAGWCECGLEHGSEHRYL